MRPIHQSTFHQTLMVSSRPPLFHHFPFSQFSPFFHFFFGVTYNHGDHYHHERILSKKSYLVIKAKEVKTVKEVKSDGL